MGLHVGFRLFSELQIEVGKRVRKGVKMGRRKVRPHPRNVNKRIHLTRKGSTDLGGNPESTSNWTSLNETGHPLWDVNKGLDFT